MAAPPDGSYTTSKANQLNSQALHTGVATRAELDDPQFVGSPLWANGKLPEHMSTLVTALSEPNQLAAEDIRAMTL